MKRILISCLAGLLCSFTDSGIVSNTLQNQPNKEIYKQLFMQEPTPSELLLKETYGIVSNNTPVNLPFDVTAKVIITDTYGMRKEHPILHKAKMHTGIDFAGKKGTSIHPAASGVVEKVSYSPGYGLYIIVDHGNGLSTLYGHLKSTTVKLNQTVNIDDKLAEMGRSGLATGYHLHFEVRYNDKPINPAKLFSKRHITKSNLLKYFTDARNNNTGESGNVWVSNRTYRINEILPNARNSGVLRTPGFTAYEGRVYEKSYGN